MINAAVVDNALEIQHQFQSALPFKYVVIDNFLQPENAAALLRDFPSFDKKYALNEHGEVGLKAVVTGVSSISAFYGAFYKYINSAAFLQQISDLTGIQNLIADATLFGGGTHENRDGQSLDIHVDFNIDDRRMLHRRLNVLVYLNPEWDETWGGMIALHSNPWDQSANQKLSFAPVLNRALIFETNEYSWHGFERINLPPDKKALSRKSFSIYLYTKDRPVEEVVAPHTTFYVPNPLPQRFVATHTLNEADAAELRTLMASRDGLLRMYQKLLIEKEQRLHDVMAVNKDGEPVHRIILSSRTWRFFMFLYRLRMKFKAWIA
jgi:2OG-Fe(II) oxygenase superfamily